jgi:chaperonin GroEL
MSTANGDRKVYKFDAEAHTKIADGLAKGAKMVASTMGPAGRTVLIGRKFRSPISVDDGITSINNLILEDELENLGIGSLVDAANKASEHAGDGTSTTIVLTEAIYREGRKLAGEGAVVGGKNPYEIRKIIDSEKKIVLEELKLASKEIKTQEEIRAVAISAYADEEMADIVSDMVFKVGLNGVVIVEEGWGRETETEILTGMRFAGKLAHNLFANTAEENLNLENLPILVSDFDYVNLNDLSAIFKDTIQAGEQGLIVVGNKFERVAIDQAIQTNLFNARNRSAFRIYLVKTPSFTPREFENFAIFTGAKYFSKEKGDKVLDCVVGDLGRSSEFKISKAGDGIAIGGAGKKEVIDARIEELKLKLADEKVKSLKGRYEQEIASLASAIGIIKVASPSEAETEQIRLKVKNAVKSAQAAIQEGVVKAGGLALKEISDKLPDGILKEAIKAPYEAIQRNAGGKLEIPDIYDATKIIRTAVEQACSQAVVLLNLGTIIDFRTEMDRGDAARIIAERPVEVKTKRDYD